MTLLILLLVLAIFVETTILLFKKYDIFTSDRRKIFVDTSALIDGRIIDVVKTGFLVGDFIILKDVLLELQLLADSKDAEKRARARAGIAAASELERVININTEILDSGPGRKKVDEALLKFAKENKGAILSLDYNLMKVAEAENIEVLNINDLALAVKNDLVLNQHVEVRITEKGSNPGQGVGHLSDGTMVVVDKASNKIGKDLTVEIMKFHETSSGKMVFAKIVKKK